MSKSYTYPEFPYRQSAAQREGRVERHPLVVIGAGPIGLSIALDCAQRGLSVLLLSMSGDMIEQQIRLMAEQYPQMPPDVRDRLLSFSAGPHLVLLMAFITIPMYAIFSMLGALLGLLFFHKPSAPASQA